MSNPDTTYTKIFVGSLPWTTKNDGLQSFLQQFGEIVHVNVVCDKQTNRSKGFGFVTFKDVESARRAYMNPNPIIDERVANCNLASEGRKVNQNEPNVRQEDLCYNSQSFMQNQQQYGPTYVQPLWNNCYQYYDPQLLYYHHQPQLVPQQYVPQFGLYQCYLPRHQDMNVARENGVEASSFQ